MSFLKIALVGAAVLATAVVAVYKATGNAIDSIESELPEGESIEDVPVSVIVARVGEQLQENKLIKLVTLVGKEAWALFNVAYSHRVTAALVILAVGGGGLMGPAFFVVSAAAIKAAYIVVAVEFALILCREIKAVYFPTAEVPEV